MIPKNGEIAPVGTAEKALKYELSVIRTHPCCNFDHTLMHHRFSPTVAVGFGLRCRFQLYNVSVVILFGIIDDDNVSHCIHIVPYITI